MKKNSTVKRNPLTKAYRPSNVSYILIGDKVHPTPYPLMDPPCGASRPDGMFDHIYAVRPTKKELGDKNTFCPICKGAVK